MAPPLLALSSQALSAARVRIRHFQGLAPAVQSVRQIYALCLHAPSVRACMFVLALARTTDTTEVRGVIAGLVPPGAIPVIRRPVTVPKSS